MDSIKKYWLGLQARERLILVVGSFIVATILLYALLLQPLYRALNHMETALPSLRENLVWMRQTDQVLEAGNNLPTTVAPLAGADESLLSVLESTARRANIRKSIQELIPVRDKDDVRVVLQDVNFNQWLRWIDILYRRNGVDIRQLSAERDDDKPNVAEIRVTFFRK